LIPEEHWTKIQKIARIRAENILINSLYQCYVFSITGINESGKWVAKIRNRIIHKEQLAKVIDDMFSGEYLEPQYASQYFMEYLPTVFIDETSTLRIIGKIKKCLDNG